MPIIGITGGIGTGKSTVSTILGELGAVTFSADDAAREVLAPDSDGLREVAAAFGAEVIGPDGSLDRAKVAEIVFKDSRAREKLERITHPRILALLRKWIEKARRGNPPGTIIVVEVPLLFEAGMEEWFDSIVVVAASEESQLKRLRHRSGLSEEEARSRIGAQIPIGEKASRAQHVIHNDGSISDLRKAIGRLWDDLA